MTTANRSRWKVTAIAAVFFAAIVALVGCTHSEIQPQPTSPLPTSPASISPVSTIPKPNDQSVTTPETSPIPPLLPTPTTKASPKVLPPLDIGMTIEEKELFVGGEFPLTLMFIPQENVRHATGQIEASGVVFLKEVPNVEWSDLSAGQEVIARMTFGIENVGEGEIRWEVQVTDESGNVVYSRRADLYFLVTEQQILTGTNSPLFLRLEYLESALEEGAMTQDEYDQAVEDVLGGGALETSESQ